MITSIFSKSKPINFLIVLFITLIFFTIAKLKFENTPITGIYVLKQIAIFLVCFATILLLNFIVTKNKLTQNNNFEILLFTLFLATLPVTFIRNEIIISNFFILLGFRRMVSLRSPNNINKKLFDSAFWIAIASLFYFWAILFFALIILTLFFYTVNQIKHWIIPFVALIAVFLILVSYNIIVFDNYLLETNYPPNISFDFSAYNTKTFILSITILISFGIWSSIYYLTIIKKKMKNIRPSFKIVFMAMLIAFSIVIISPLKDGSEFIFLFAPLAIIMTNYIEIIKDNWFKEVFLFILIALPILNLLL